MIALKEAASCMKLIAATVTRGMQTTGASFWDSQHLIRRQSAGSLLRHVTRSYSTAGAGEAEEGRSQTGLSKTVNRLQSAAMSQALPLAFVSTMAMGYMWPDPGVMLADANFTKYCTFGVFIASGLLLEKKEAAKALNAKGSILYGLTSILLLTPLAAPLIMSLPIEPKELIIGLAVFLLTPTTLSTGVTLTQAARANVAMALLLTLTSNFVAVFTIPVTLSMLMDTALKGAITLSPLVLLKNLTLTVLIPTISAYMLKTGIQGGEQWIRQRKKLISRLGSTCLMMIPWMQISRASMSGISIDPTSLSLAVSAGVAAHIAFFAINHFLARSMKLGGSADPLQVIALRRAVVMMSSQKSVTIAIAVLTQLSAYLPAEAIGIACIPSHWARSYQSMADGTKERPSS